MERHDHRPRPRRRCADRTKRSARRLRKNPDIVAVRWPTQRLADGPSMLERVDALAGGIAKLGSKESVTRWRCCWATGRCYTSRTPRGDVERDPFSIDITYPPEDPLHGRRTRMQVRVRRAGVLTVMLEARKELPQLETIKSS